MSEHRPSGAVVWCEGVTKFYRRGAERSNLRAALPGRAGRRRSAEDVAALDNVTMSAQAGESIGLIGPNGAGKTTLLKAVAGVIAPTSGRLGTHGRLAPMIDLGVGFHPELTGADNIRYVASLMGLGRRELRRTYDDIVSFAGIEASLDTPVKRFSTGMLARLGFAIASSVEADVMLVDEVLAVGDADFQRSSFDRIRNLQRQGTAVILVSHNLWVIAQFCDRVLRFDHGRVVDEGAPVQVIDRYSGAGAAAGASWGRSPVRLSGLILTPASIEEHGVLDVTVTVEVDRPLPAATLQVGVVMVTNGDGLHAPCTAVDPDLLRVAGRWEVTARINNFPFGAGYYTVAMTVVNQGQHVSRAVGEVHVRGQETGRTDYLPGTRWRAERVVG